MPDSALSPRPRTVLRAPSSAEEESGFAELLRSIRVRSGLTQKALADLSTISPRTIRDLESGRAHARVQTVQLLADGLRLQGLIRELFIHAGLRGRRRPAQPELGLAAPRPVNAILGRDTEIRVMIEVLESGRRRMVSLSGLPGVGKTRVATEIAARLASRRGWPVLWIGAAARTPDGHGASSPLLRSLRLLLESGAEEVAQVCRLIGRHEALIVFDGAADTQMPAGLAELLAYCPNLRVISTSRAPWQVTGVQSAVIAPLPVPDAAYCHAPAAELCSGLASMRLLVERLTEVRPGFTLDSADAAAAALLCRRLDGLPAALEAVAGFFRVFTLRQIARASSADLLGLAVPSRDPAAPASTLGDLLASSLDVLDERRLAVLRELVRPNSGWSVGDLAVALGRGQHEIVEDLSVLISRGLVHAPTGESADQLRVPNLLRAVLGHTERRAAHAAAPSPAEFAWH